MYGLMVVVIFQMVWLVVLSFMYRKQQQFLYILTKDVSKKDLKTILKNIVQSIRTIGNEIQRVDQNIDRIENHNSLHVQKVGFVRFNPYGDTGGDQSFCLALLNQYDTGILLTSLHSREQTRIYAKPIANGKADGIQFSKEESEAVSKALMAYTSTLKKNQARV